MREINTSRVREPMYRKQYRWNCIPQRKSRHPQFPWPAKRRKAKTHPATSLTTSLTKAVLLLR